MINFELTEEHLALQQTIRVYKDERNNDSDRHDAFDAPPIKAFLSFQTAS